MTDLISRADAIEAVKETKPIVRSTERNWGKMIAEQHSKELVKALKSLPSAETHEIRTETHGVCLISKDDAMGAVRKKLQDWGSYAFEDYRRGLYEAQDIIEALPSADAVSRVDVTNASDSLDEEDVSAEAVQGEWEHWGSPFSDESEVIDTIVCSVCGARFIEPKDETKGEYNYCPNCGARMTPYKGGDDE